MRPLVRKAVPILLAATILCLARQASANTMCCTLPSSSSSVTCVNTTGCNFDSPFTGGFAAVEVDQVPADYQLTATAVPNPPEPFGAPRNNGFCLFSNPDVFPESQIAVDCIELQATAPTLVPS
jgi:hypothetical protein